MYSPDSSLSCSLIEFFLSIPFFDGLIYLVAQQFITLKDVLSIFNVDVWLASVKVESNGNRIAAGSNQCSSE